MKMEKIFSGIADFLTAYCVGRCNLFGTAPFGTAIIGAGSACGRNPWLMLFGLFGAFLEQDGYVKQGTWIYPVIWMVAAVVVRSRKLQLLYPRSFLLSVLVGLITMVLQIGTSYMLPDALGIPMACAEGVLVFSFMLALYKQLIVQFYHLDEIQYTGDVKNVVLTSKKEEHGYI